MIVAHHSPILTTPPKGSCAEDQNADAAVGAEASMARRSVPSAPEQCKQTSLTPLRPCLQAAGPGLATAVTPGALSTEAPCKRSVPISLEENHGLTTDREGDRR